MQISEALGRLDPNDDAHWTNGGLPAVKLVGELVGNVDLTRADINEAAPDFTRDAARALAGASGAQPPPNSAPPDQAQAPDRKVDYGRTWLYHPDCPKGRIFEGEACADALEDGWVETPAKRPAASSTRPK